MTKTRLTVNIIVIISSFFLTTCREQNKTSELDMDLGISAHFFEGMPLHRFSSEQLGIDLPRHTVLYRIDTNPTIFQNFKQHLKLRNYIEARPHSVADSSDRSYFKAHYDLNYSILLPEEQMKKIDWWNYKTISKDSLYNGFILDKGDTTAMIKAAYQNGHVYILLEK